MKLETLLQIIRPGHQVRLDEIHELETTAGSEYEYLVPEGHLDREVTSLRFSIEPDDPGIRLLTDISTGAPTTDRSCFLEDLLQKLDLEEEAEVHVRRGSEKLGHASPCRIRNLLSNSVLESSVESVSADLNREWDMVLDIQVR